MPITEVRLRSVIVRILFLLPLVFNVSTMVAILWWYLTSFVQNACYWACVFTSCVCRVCNGVVSTASVHKTGEVSFYLSCNFFSCLRVLVNASFLSLALCPGRESWTWSISFCLTKVTRILQPVAVSSALTSDTCNCLRLSQWLAWAFWEKLYMVEFSGKWPRCWWEMSNYKWKVEAPVTGMMSFFCDYISKLIWSYFYTIRLTNWNLEINKKSYFLLSGLFIHWYTSVFGFLSCWGCSFAWLIWSIEYFIWSNDRKSGILLSMRRVM